MLLNINGIKLLLLPHYYEHGFLILLHLYDMPTFLPKMFCFVSNLQCKEHFLLLYQ